MARYETEDEKTERIQRELRGEGAARPAPARKRAARPPKPPEPRPETPAQMEERLRQEIREEVELEIAARGNVVRDDSPNMTYVAGVGNGGFGRDAQGRFGSWNY